MSYSCCDFTDDILDALHVDVPEESCDSPSDQADLALAAITRLDECKKLIDAISRMKPISFDSDDDDLESHVVAFNTVIARAKKISGV